MINSVLKCVYLDDDNTGLLFKIRTSFLTLVKGSLKNINGELFWSNYNTSENHLMISADTTTVKTELEERDVLFKDRKHLDIFSFDRLSLRAKNFIQLDQLFYAVAQLQIKDITQDVMLRVSRDYEKRTLMCRFSFNRLDFDLGEESELYEEQIFVAFDIRLEE